MVTTQEKFSGNPFPCERTGCGQQIAWKENENIFVNMYDGPGGHQGNRHSCVNRQERYKTNPNDKYTNFLNCPRCDKKYDAAYFFECPYCFKMCCQNCGHLFHWHVFQRNCPRCNDMRTRQIEMTKYKSESPFPDPKTGKYKKQYVPRPSADITEEIGLIVKSYHTMKEHWESNNMKMKCVVSNCRNDVTDKSDYCIEHITSMQKA